MPASEERGVARTMKNSLLMGFAVGAFPAINDPEKIYAFLRRSDFSLLARMGKYWISTMAVTGIYGASLLFLRHIRGKDDKWNYLLSVFPATGVMYSAMKCGPLAFGLGFYAFIGIAITEWKYIRDGVGSVTPARIQDFECFNFTTPLEKAYLKKF